MFDPEFVPAPNALSDALRDESAPAIALLLGLSYAVRGEDQSRTFDVNNEVGEKSVCCF